MSSCLFLNNYRTTLGATFSSTATVMTVSSTVGLPASLATGQFIPMTLTPASNPGSVYEIVYVTGISGANLTVTRGQESTSALNWVVGDIIFSTNTAGTTLSPNSSVPINASGLITANGGITVPVGETLTVDGSISSLGYPSSSGVNRVFFTPPPTNTSPTTYSWTCPPDVTKIVVKGAGGGGGGYLITGVSSNPGVSGGSPGQTAGAGEASIPVTPGQVYTIVVGGGGATGSPGLDGQATTFSLGATTYVTFSPGQGGPSEYTCNTTGCAINCIGPNVTSSTYGGAIFANGATGVAYSNTSNPAAYGNLVTQMQNLDLIFYFVLQTPFSPYGSPGLGSTSFNGGAIANSADGAGGFLQIEY